MMEKNIDLDAFSNVLHKGIIEVFLEDVEFFKKQKNLLLDVDFSAFYVIPLAENGINNSPFFQFFVGLQNGVARQRKLQANLVDGR